MLCATTACTFSTCQLPKVLQHWSILYISTWKCASRHNGVHFFDISTSKSVLNVSLGNVLRATTSCNFSSLIWPDGSAPAALALRSHKPLEKHSESRLSCLFAHLDLLLLTVSSSDPLSSSLLFSSFLFSSLLFSYSFHLCFSCVHIVGGLASKLPSVVIYQ